MINMMAPGDFFLPQKHLSKEEKFRARAIINIIGIAFIFVLLALIYGIVSGSYINAQVKVGLTAVSLQFGFLLFIKYTGHIDFAGFAFVALASLFSTVVTVYVGKSLLVTSTHTLISAMIMGFFFTTKTHYRVMLGFAVASCTLFAFWQLKDLGLVRPYGVEPQVFIDQVYLNYARRNLLVLACMVLYSKLKKLAYRDLDEEITVRTQEEKVSEVMFLIRSTFPEMRKTLERLKEETQHYQRYGRPRSDQTFQAIEESVNEMARVSRSMTWIYRACRNESVDRTSLEQVQIGLEDLLSRKLLHSGWGISFKSETTRQYLQGPIPSLMLLHISLIDRITKVTPVDAEPIIHFETAMNGEELSFIIRAPISSPAIKVSDPFRREMIEDLLRASSAEMQEFVDASGHVLTVKGRWLA